MDVTAWGIDISVRDWQSSNALSPMLVTVLGIVKLERDIHERNALSPMLVKLNFTLLLLWLGSIKVSEVQ